MNKSLITHIICLIFIMIGLFYPLHFSPFLMIGLFALSGSITNWIAIHMLFEKVPFLYGSGVIPNRFEDFKIGIKTLIVDEFFNHEHIERLFSNQSQHSLADITNHLDFDHIFEELKDAIVTSPLGNMIGMIGGKEALNPLKEPVIIKLKEIITQLANDPENLADQNITAQLMSKVEQIIDTRLNELTPDMVKTIIQTMIRKHLDWLVVWGGVFGGLIGAIASALNGI